MDDWLSQFLKGATGLGPYTDPSAGYFMQDPIRNVKPVVQNLPTEITAGATNPPALDAPVASSYAPTPSPTTMPAERPTLDDGTPFVGPLQSDAGPATPSSGFDASKLLAGLKGVQAPKPVDVVKPSTPAAPVRTPIQSGEFLALLNALGHPVAPQPRPGLGALIGTGRY